MKLAIMQPYFLPYIGYFQLIAAVDQFIVYDNIKYTKKGWINRNRMLRGGEDVVFSLPIKSGSDSLDVCGRELAPDFDRKKLLAQFQGAYRRAPYFVQVFPVIEAIVNHGDANLFGYIFNAIAVICRHLDINTELKISSSVPISHDLKGEDKVISLCLETGADTYVNAIGGMELYSRDMFQDRGIALKFIKSKLVEYPQFDGAFVPWLSIVDVMMFNSPEALRKQITEDYELI